MQAAAILGRIQQTGTLHGSSELFQVTGRDFTQGEPEAADIPPHQAKRGLYGDGVDLQKKRVDQIHICNLKLGSLLEASVQTQVCHIHHQLGGDIGHNRDDAFGAQGHHRDHLIIIAGPDVKIISTEVSGMGNQGKISAGLLDTVDFGVLRKRTVGIGGKRDARAGGNIVENDG